MVLDGYKWDGENPEGPSRRMATVSSKDKNDVNSPFIKKHLCLASCIHTLNYVQSSIYWITIKTLSFTQYHYERC